MEFKIPPNLVIVLIVVIGFIVLINLNVISFFGTWKKDKDIAVQEYVTNKKIDSLIQVIQENQESIGKYNEKIEEYQKSIEGIDKKITKNQKELDKIAKEYEETINNIDDYTSNDIYKYFSERYEWFSYMFTCKMG